MNIRFYDALQDKKDNHNHKDTSSINFKSKNYANLRSPYCFLKSGKNFHIGKEKFLNQKEAISMPNLPHKILIRSCSVRENF